MGSHPCSSCGTQEQFKPETLPIAGAQAAVSLSSPSLLFPFHSVGFRSSPFEFLSNRPGPSELGFLGQTLGLCFVWSLKSPA